MWHDRAAYTSQISLVSMLFCWASSITLPYMISERVSSFSPRASRTTAGPRKLYSSSSPGRSTTGIEAPCRTQSSSSFYRRLECDDAQGPVQRVERAELVASGHGVFFEHLEHLDTDAPHFQIHVGFVVFVLAEGSLRGWRAVCGLERAVNGPGQLLRTHIGPQVGNG